MQSVDRIWFERGEWKDITEKSLMQSIERKHNQQEVDTEQETEYDLEHQQSALVSTQPPPGFDVAKLRESVINKLLYVDVSTLF